MCACDILLVCADDRITGQMSVLKCPLVTFSPPLSHDPLLPGTHRCAWMHWRAPCCTMHNPVLGLNFSQNSTIFGCRLQRQAPCLSRVLGSVDVDQSAEMVHMAIKRQNFVGWINTVDPKKMCCSNILSCANLVLYQSRNISIDRKMVSTVGYRRPCEQWVYRKLQEFAG